MKVKTSELSGAALDWAVGQAEDCPLPPVGYSTKWEFGGPIIERELISVSSQTNGHSWAAKGAHNYSYGPTPLIAAMRCYCYTKLGSEVDVPEELI